ncbi:hypothetical protein BJ165DRAFT_1437086 [Panaeolus papilionaceus]|nr:hypothetical protein BJ165DRAFT_1437086 [Panaeolus papilionaceus]
MYPLMIKDQIAHHRFPQVFGRLHPTDLLNLSRTSKAYRRFLTDRGSANLWRVSFRNVPGTPEPFEDMSFPAWAYLLFCNQCHFCDFRPSNIDWTFKIRACTRCVHTVLNVTHAKVPKGVHPRSLAARVFRDRIHTNICKSWDAKQDAESPEEIKEDRLEKIKSKLNALGWGTPAQTYVERAAVLQPIVTRPQKFTDEVWEEIGPYIVSHLEDRIRQGLSFDLKVSPPKILEQRWDAHRMALAAQFWRNYRVTYFDPAAQDLPSGLEFVSLKPVVDILQCPRHVVVTLESFYRLIPLMPEMIRSWRDNMRMLEG